MKTLLTPHLLGFLIERGFTYCLVQTQIISKPDACAVITLTPVRIKPELKNLSGKYEKLIRITREPMQMALGMQDTEVYINLDFKKDKKLSLLRSSSEHLVSLN